MHMRFFSNRLETPVRVSSYLIRCAFSKEVGYAGDPSSRLRHHRVQRRPFPYRSAGRNLYDLT